MSNTQKTIDDSKKSVEIDEVRIREGNESILKISEKITSILKILLRHPKIFLQFTELVSKCNNKDLIEGKGVYSNYKFNGTHFPASSLMISADMSESRNIDFDSKDPEIQKLIFANSNCIKYLIENGVDADSNKEIRQILHNISSYLTGDKIKISSESEENLKTALILAREKNKKIVILANHISHLDAPILDYILSNKLDLQGKDSRFVCGAFMYYNRGVRPYTVGFNTMFVYGPEDLKNTIERVGSKGRRLILDFDKKIKESMLENKENEVLVLFPYAGRAKKGKDINYKYGCKDRMPNGIKGMISNEECLYIPIGFDGTNDIFGKENSGGGGNMLKNFTNIVQTQIGVSVGKSFVGGEKDLQEISDIMLAESVNAYNKNHE